MDDPSFRAARLNFTLPEGASRPQLVSGSVKDLPLSRDQSVSFHLEVDANGVPGNIAVINSTDQALESKTGKALQRWRFSPAMLNGIALPVEGVFELGKQAPSVPTPPTQQTPGPLAPAITTTTTHEDSKITATVNVAPGSEVGFENYILHIHAEGPASYIRYILWFTLDDAPGTNRQTRGQRDGYVTRDSNGSVDVLIPTGGKLKDCKVTLSEEVPPRTRVN
ncbi:MAG TPA: energy transducer TonB [Candidatus Sulfotelmatobacter sp.]|nr:energy transducer TonB [Candidatus Sulfotelmatobacter sp.]